MRFALSGGLNKPKPVVVTFNVDNGPDQTFDAAAYIALGYTNFDVICIGGGGGSGGGIINQGGGGTGVRNYGGAGGGGGLHRVQGVLSALPDSVDVVIGFGGPSAVETATDPSLLQDAWDGQPSTFNGTTCRASGGKAGKKVQTNSTTVSTQANGGQGGVGNSIVAGGGAAGGLAGTPTATGPGTPGTPGTHGTWDGSIGQGGGGGAGGVAKYAATGPGTTLNAGTPGGHGSYNIADTSVSANGASPYIDIDTAAPNIVPGMAGGGKATPLTGLTTTYGDSGDLSGTRPLEGKAGIVVVRLTAL